MTIRGAMTYNRYRVRRNTTEPGFSFTARNDQVSQTLLIPGLDRLNPLDLFSAGQPGGWADPYDLTRMWVDDAGTTPATIASLGTGIGRVITKGNAITLTQANAADRPVWGRHPVSGIRQLLVNSNFDGAVAGSPGTAPTNWINAISTGEIVSYDSTSGKLRLLTAGTRRGFSQAANMAINSTQIASVRVNVISGSVGVGRVITPSSATPAGASLQWQINGVNVANSGVVLPLGESVLSLIMTTTTNAWTLNIEFGNGVGGATTGDLEIWEPQLEFGSVRTPYQRVTNRFDITEVGSPSLYYFSGNGVNQRWESNATVNFSGTDKVTVWAGAQRLSNAARGTIVELTSSIASNNGAFHMTGPNAVSDTFGWESKGTTLRDAVATVALGSPRRLVGVGDISGDLSRLIVDGTATDNTGDQGTGNYSNATLHVFSRGGSSQFFNGRLYSLIIAGGLYDSRTIQRFSDWTLKPRRLITA